MDSGTSKQEGELGAGASLTMPLVDFNSLWKTHPSIPPELLKKEEVPPEGRPLIPGTPVKARPSTDMEYLWRTHPSIPPGFQKEQEVQPLGVRRAPGTPAKPSTSMDMEYQWKTHPGLQPRFAGFNRMENDKEPSPDSHKAAADSGTVDCDNGRQSNNLINLEALGYGSSNATDENTDTWDAPLAGISFTQLLASANSAAPLGSLFSDLQASGAVNSTIGSTTKNLEVPVSNYHEENQNHQPSRSTGLALFPSDLNRNAGSTDGAACPNMGLDYSAHESTPLQDPAAAKVRIASGVESILTSEKGGRKKNIDLNKKPRQPKPKKKKHRPKVVVDDDGRKKKTPKTKSKSRPKAVPKTPKPLTPKPVILKKTRKGKKKFHCSQALVELHTTKSCKKGLNFEIETLLTQDVHAQRNQNVQQITHKYRLRHPNRSWKWRFNLNLEFQYGEELNEDDEVIKMENREDEFYSDCNSIHSCSSNNRKMIFPVLPRKYKKKRSQRRRALMRFLTVAAACPTAALSLVRRKKRSNMAGPRRNLASLLAIPVCDELPGRKDIPSENPRKPETVRVAEIREGLSDKVFMEKHSPTSTTTPQQSNKKKRKRQTKNPPPQIEIQANNINGCEEVHVDFLVQKLELLSITDKSNNQLVPYTKSEPKSNQLVRYQAKKPIPKVDLDPETLKMWNLIVYQNRGEGVEDKMDQNDEKRWEEEREVFRQRVDSFLNCMHILQGDRRFQPWKGSVLDSVVGVYLTQNVSDKLSSSAFMTMAALFPLPSSTNDTPCYIVEEDEEEDCQTSSDQIPSATYLKTNMTAESNEREIESSLNGSEQCNEMGKTENKNLNNSNEGKKGKNNGKEDSPFDWDSLRRFYSCKGRSSRNLDAKDSLDWEAVRHASVSHVAKAISARGMNNVLAVRIKDFLDRMVQDHGKLDLEWLRDVPPEKAKDYLLSIKGLGLKSVECVRLLTLHHHAFPVDTNVARITVRLGWVPLQPLPSDVFLHSLDQYPPMDTIQKYLWPRLCTLDQKTLYELHYQMITFGKVFCTKRNPYCEACPLKANCKHYASAMASRKPLLQNGAAREKGDNGQPAPPFLMENHPVVQTTPNYIYPSSGMEKPSTSSAISISILGDGLTSQSTESTSKNYEPIVEMPTSPELEIESVGVEERDIEDFCDEDYDEIPTLRLGEEFRAGMQDDYPCMYPTIQEDHASQALVSVATSMPTRKLKYISRLRTEHYVYELPDSHRLLIERGMRRESCDLCSFLLAVWSPGETADTFEQPQRRCSLERPGELCNDETCSSCNAAREQDSQTIRGTLLIPCRTAMRGSFPLNGTYFQVNEVFADDETSRNPIIVHRAEIWNLPRRVAYFGSSTTSIFRGLSDLDIKNCFWQGYICVRGFNRKTRAPMPLVRRLHISPSTLGKGKVGDDEDL